VTPDLAEELELEEPAGVLISRAYQGSPADEAGLERRDVIVEFDGQSISALEELPQAVADTPVGKTVVVRVVRDGKREKIRVEVGEMETPELADTVGASQSPESFGLRTQTLTKELAERLGIDEDHGVVIAEVEPDSPAEEAGLRRGDVIVEVDKEEVEDTAELKELLKKADDRALVAVRRGRSSLYVVLKRE